MRSAVPAAPGTRAPKPPRTEAESARTLPRPLTPKPAPRGAGRQQGARRKTQTAPEAGGEARHPKPDSDPDAAEKSPKAFYSEMLNLLFFFLVKRILKALAEIAEALHAGDS